MNQFRSVVTFVALSISAMPATAFASVETMEWVRQVGASDIDQSFGVSADGLGSVYVAGVTSGDFGGPNAGDNDAFIANYDAAGSLLWTRQFGTIAADSALGVSADGLGSVYVTGGTYGDLGGPNAGDNDAFIAKYDSAGGLLWTRQLGTNREDRSNSVSADGLGSVYITGFTWGELSAPNAEGPDMFVAKYDASGGLLWTRQLSAIHGFSNGISADGLGNVYLTGWTNANGNYLDTGNAIVVKFDEEGNHLWSRQFGANKSEESYGVSADGLGNVFITGVTTGDLGNPQTAENEDAFVAKYDAAGNAHWIRQLGTSQPDLGFGVSADGLGNVYTTGWTGGNLAGRYGRFDTFVAKHDADGALVWIQQFGTIGDDNSFGLSADGLGNAYVTGYTTGNLGGPISGSSDAFVAKYASRHLPEPTSSGLLVCAATLLISIWQKPLSKLRGRDMRMPS